MKRVWLDLSQKSTSMKGQSLNKANATKYEVYNEYGREDYLQGYYVDIMFM